MRGERGYILVEALVSMGLLSICMLAIYSSMRDAASMRGRAEDFTTARFLMESIAAEHELQLEVVEGSGSGVFPPPNERFAYTWAISRVEIPMVDLPAAMPDEQRAQLEQQFSKYMGRLAISIRWNRAGLDHSVTGETLLRPGQLWTPPEL